MQKAIDHIDTKLRDGIHADRGGEKKMLALLELSREKPLSMGPLALNMGVLEAERALRNIGAHPPFKRQEVEDGDGDFSLIATEKELEILLSFAPENKLYSVLFRSFDFEKCNIIFKTKKLLGVSESNFLDVLDVHTDDIEKQTCIPSEKGGEFTVVNMVKCNMTYSTDSSIVEALTIYNF